MSLLQTLARWVVSFRGNIFRTEETLRKHVDGLGAQRVPRLPRSLRAACDVSEFWIDDQKIVQLTPRRRTSDAHLIYIHGGAYIHEIVTPHWNIIAQLVKHTGATVTVPLYALAPEHDHRKATAMMDALYDRIVDSPAANRIFVAGDSAGGNFALSLALRRRDAGKSLPAGLILYAPWLDLELTSDGLPEMEARDVMLAIEGLRICGQWWAGPADPASPYLSVTNADPSGLPPLAIFQGDLDLFVIDARRFADRCRAQGVPTTYREYRGGFHVFMGATFTPEARDVFRRTKDFMTLSRERP